MDIRLLSLMMLIVAVVSFLVGRRTSPGGRTVHRLQREIDARVNELADYQAQIAHFLKDMHGEAAKLAHAHFKLEHKLVQGAKKLQIKVPAATNGLHIERTERLLLSSAETKADTSMDADFGASDVHDWQAPTRYNEKVGGKTERPPLACPLPSERAHTEPPKDYADEIDADQAAA